MKKGIIVVVLLIVVVGGYYVYKNYTQDSVPAIVQEERGATPEEEQPVAPVVDENKQVFVVTYSASGFDPAVTKIKMGDTVNFENGNSSPMWVASAPHPAHTDYPEFDAKKGYAKGEAYSFTFTKVGTWKYHNHLNATHYGSVVVE